MSRLANTFAVAMVASAVAVGALWVRSYFVSDMVFAIGGGRVLLIHSTAGGFAFVLNRGESHALTLTRSTEEPSGDYGRALVTFDAGGLPWGRHRHRAFPALGAGRSHRRLAGGAVRPTVPPPRRARLPHRCVMTHAILRQIEALGYAVSVHTMPGHTELHAVRLSGDEVPHVARSEGNDQKALHDATCALAEMVGLRLED